MKNILKKFAVGVAALASGVLLVLGGVGAGVNISKDENGKIVIESSFSIQLAEENVPAVIENADGEQEALDVPTVEMIDSNQFSDESAFEQLDFGLGAYYDISTPQAFRDATLGKCIDLDGKWGSQCVDLFATFQYEYTGRWLSTCGTGAARGLWECRDWNAGEDYELIADPTQLQPGDFVILNGGVYGHVGMALGYYNNGYIALLGENQGGAPCPDGGAATNIINMSLSTFLGAFRPKTYVKPQPTPVDDCSSIELEWGDTLGKIQERCDGSIDWSSMDEYAKRWTSDKYGESVYYGWYNNYEGIGLYAGDTIRRAE